MPGPSWLKEVHTGTKPIWWSSPVGNASRCDEEISCTKMVMRRRLPILEDNGRYNASLGADPHEFQTNIWCRRIDNPWQGICVDPVWVGEFSSYLRSICRKLPH